MLVFRIWELLYEETLMLDDPDGYINATLSILIMVSMALAFLIP